MLAVRLCSRISFDKLARRCRRRQRRRFTRHRSATAATAAAELGAGQTTDNEHVPYERCTGRARRLERIFTRPLCAAAGNRFRATDGRRAGWLAKALFLARPSARATLPGAAHARLIY